jgi:hypothetical protein
MPATAVESMEPVRPRVIVSDTTPEKLGALSAGQPRGLLYVRDELSGWFGAFDRYGGNGAERALWLEAFGGRAYVIDRKNNPRPIEISHFSIGVLGGVQPERLVDLLAGVDDGLSSRFLWSWPNPIPPQRPLCSINKRDIVVALRRLLELQMASDERGRPTPQTLKMPEDAVALFQQWREEHHAASGEAYGHLASAWGKMPGQLLRLALVLEHLMWCAPGPAAQQPSSVSIRAVRCAAALIEDYFKPMAARVYGDAGLSEGDRLAAILAKHIRKNAVRTFNARRLRRTAGLPGLKEANEMQLAVDHLVDLGWLRAIPSRQGDTPGRAKSDYIVNPKALGISNGE